MKNRKRFKRRPGLKGINFVSPNTDTIDLLKRIEYQDNAKAIEVLDKLLIEIEKNQPLSVSIYCYEQSLRILLYSERRLAHIEYISLLKYVERNLNMENSEK